METVERFSNRVENYVKYRPGYPPEVVGLFKTELGLREDSVIADIGCGTGILTRLLLENGNRVFGVEPNAAMRSAAEQYLNEFPGFLPVDGTAENTTLADASVDLVTAAQAFHWFDPAKTKSEFRRILKPEGRVALIWNERQLDTTPFLSEYEGFLLRFGNDYEAVRHDRLDDGAIANFLGIGFQKAVFKYTQDFDFDGLKGRMLSASYMPSEANPVYETMIGELQTLFAKHAENGRIKVFYDTNVYWSKI